MNPSPHADFSATADLHLDEFPQFSHYERGWNSRLESQLEVLLRWLAHPSRGRFGFVCGDVVNNSNPSPQVMTAVAYLFEEASKAFEQFFVITGNHDDLFKRGNPTGFTALTAFENFRPNVNIVEQPKVVGLDGFDAALMPWQSSRAKLVETVAKLQAGTTQKSRYLFAHQAVDGATVLGGTKRLPTDICLNDFNPSHWTAGFLGDYHDAQEILGAGLARMLGNSRFRYLGSPTQLNRGEAHDEERGFLYVESPTTMRTIALEGPVFRKFTPTTAVELEEARAACAAGDFVDVVLPPDFPLSLRAVRESVGSGANVQYDLEQVVVAGPRLEVKASDAVMDVFQQYLAGAYTGALDREVLTGSGVEVSERVGAGEVAVAYDGPVRFRTLEGDGFLCYGEFSVRLDTPGLVLVEGRNIEQADFFDSNGAGKSSLFDAVCFALFGRTVKGDGPFGLPVEEQANRFLKRGFWMRLVVETGQHTLEILRSRDHAEHGTGLQLTVDGEGWTKRGIGQPTQKDINALVGADIDYFRSGILFGQAVEEYFASSKPSEQQAVLDRLAGTSRFAPYAKAADELLAEHVKFTEGNRKSRDEMAVKAGYVEERLGELEEASTRWTTEHRAKAKAVALEVEGVGTRATELAEVVKALKKRAGAIVVPEDRAEDLVAARVVEGTLREWVREHERETSTDAIAAEVARVKEQEKVNLLALKDTDALVEEQRKRLDELPEVEELERRVSTFSKELAVGVPKVEELTESIGRAMASGSSFLHGVLTSAQAKDCPTCGKLVKPTDAKKALAGKEGTADPETLRTERDRLKQQNSLNASEKKKAEGLLRDREEGAQGMRRLLDARKVLETRSDELVDILARLDREKMGVRKAKELMLEKAKELEKAVAAVETLEREGNARQGAANDLREAKARLEAAERERGELLTRAEGLQKQLTELKAETNPHLSLVEPRRAELVELKAALEKAETTVVDCELLERYYRETVTIFRGLRIFVFDSLGPSITRAANRALEVLVNGTVEVKFDTGRGKTTLKESVRLEVKNRLGGASYESDSGGEKRMVDLSLLVALHEVVSGRFNVIKADEALGPLDKKASHRAADLFKVLAETRGLTVFFTTHRDDIKELCPHRWVMVKENGVTRIEVER